MNDLFNFTFEDLAGFLFAFIPALLNLTIVIYILVFLPKNRLTNIFALLTLTVVFWQLNDAVHRIIVNSADADLWDSVFSMSWLFLGPLCMHFAILYTQTKLHYGRFYITLLYAPAFLFLSLYQTHYYQHTFQHLHFWGWVNAHNKNWIDVTQIYWVSALVIFALTLLFIHTFKIRDDKLLKKQSLLITVGIAIPAVVGISFEVILPTLLKHTPMPLTSSFMTFFSIATLLALRKYKLFSVSDLINSETLLDSMPILVFSSSLTGRITYMNRTCIDTLGIKKNDLKAININQLLRHESAQQAEKFNTDLARTIENKEIMHSELTINTSKGKINIILVFNPIVNNNKVECILFTLKDITDLKTSNQLIKYNEALLAEAQQLSHIGSWEWNIESNTVIWSDELYRIFGYQPGEISITYETFLQCVHPKDRARVNNIVEKALHNHKPFDFYHRITRMDGTEVISYSQGKVTVDKENKAIRMTGTAQDVTENRKSQEMLVQQNAELQKINAELDKFVYSVSHDLRAPLTSMLGVIEISEEETTETFMKERLDLIKTNIVRLDKFILDILDYSRNARREIGKEEIDFQQILKEITQNFEYITASSRNVNIHWHIKNQNPFHSDKNRISIILSNLIQNSIIYRDPQKIDPYVEIRIDVSDKEANIIVRDNGIGIKKEIHNKIFDMFYKGSKKSIGSGLGLYIVKETVEKLHGHLQVESEIIKGSTFCVWLPNN